MDDSGYTKLAETVDEFLMLVHESAEFHTDPAIRDVLLEASRALVAIRRRLQAAADRYVVAVVGLTNVGKSTLLNALFGAELAPGRNGPCTAAPIEFMHGETLRLTVHRPRSLRRPSWSCQSLGALRARLSALVDDAGDLADREIHKVVVEAPLSLLTKGLIVADTPGFGAAQAGPAAGSHEAALKEYLRTVSQVFWVVLAEQGIGKREMTFHDTFFGEICDDVVVTGCEEWDEQDRGRYRERFADEFHSRMPRFHFVSGLQGLRARQSEDPAALETAGIPLLEQRIRQLTDASGRHRAIQEALLVLAADLHYWLSEHRENGSDRLTIWWRPDSWSRWTANAPDCSLNRQISVQLGAEP